MLVDKPVAWNWEKVETPFWMAAVRPASGSKISVEGESIEHVPPLVALDTCP